VLGGLAVRHELTFDTLEDLQVALGALLECSDEEGEVTIRVRAGRTELQVAVGPFDEQALSDALDGQPAGGLDLRRVLDTVADRVERTTAEDGAWIELTKRVAPAETVDG
jgi:hypothetical protein